MQDKKTERVEVKDLDDHKKNIDHVPHYCTALNEREKQDEVFSW